MKKKFFNTFTIIVTSFAIVISAIAGWLLGHIQYNDYWNGTIYIFKWETAIGYWLLGILITLIIYFLSVLVYSHVSSKNQKD